METISMKYPETLNYVGGKMVAGKANRFMEVISPIDGAVLSRVALSTKEDLNDAVEIAKKAFVTWSATSNGVSRRSPVGTTLSSSRSPLEKRQLIGAVNTR